MLLILSHICQAHSSAATRIRGWQTHLSCALPIAALPSSPAASKPFPNTRLSSQILPGLQPKGQSGCVGVKGTNFSSFSCCFLGTNLVMQTRQLLFKGSPHSCGCKAILQVPSNLVFHKKSRTWNP